MKKKYKILLIIFLIEVEIVSILSKTNIRAETVIENAIGLIVCLLPIQILLFMLSRDEKCSQRIRTCCKIAFWHINICYLLGAIVSII